MFVEFCLSLYVIDISLTIVFSTEDNTTEMVTIEIADIDWVPRDIKKWIKDLPKLVGVTKQSYRLPAYGLEVDNELKIVILALMNLGLPVDNIILREHLVNKLEAAGKLNLLRENGIVKVYFVMFKLVTNFVIARW